MPAAADALVRQAGLTWPEVIAPPQQLLPPPKQDRDFETVADICDFCLRRPEQLIGKSGSAHRSLGSVSRRRQNRSLC
jgi:hypothetical protein